MHNLDVILTLTGGLAAALTLGYVTHRLGFSPIVGYLLAGIAVGPFTPGYVADHHVAEQLAEVGVILLMFGVGLQFHVHELLAVRRIAVPGAIVQSAFATLLATCIGHAFGWSWSAGFVFGISLSVASTVVLIRLLADNRELHTPAGQIAVGWLVVEDLFTVLVLVVLPVMFGRTQGTAGEIAIAFSLAAAKVVVLVASVFVLGGRVVPWLLDRAAATRSRELFSLTVLVTALGVAVGSAKLFGVSMALGAFLAGMVVGRTDFSLRAASEVLPMRDAFAVLFFVSVGMLLNPLVLMKSAGIVGATLAVVMIGKPLAALGISVWLGYPLRTGPTVAVGLAQIGEFSFMLGILGRDLGILDEKVGNVLVAAAIVSITLNPLLYRLIPPIDLWASRRAGLMRFLNSRAQKSLPKAASKKPEKAPPKRSHRSIIVGYGPVGQTVARLLKENRIEPTVIELNMETVRRLRESGIDAVYGDATHVDILKAAGVQQAGSLVLSASDIRAGEEAIRLAKELNPSIHILARTIYVRDLSPLRMAGADVVFSAESEIALSLTEAILRSLGATPEQIDRERERVHADLLGSKPAAIGPVVPKPADTGSMNGEQSGEGTLSTSPTAPSESNGTTE